MLHILHVNGFFLFSGSGLSRPGIKTASQILPSHYYCATQMLYYYHDYYQ